MTRKLFYEALYQTEFDADVLRQEEREGRVYAVLDQTLFYPGGGGQPYDLGELGGRTVLEVLEEGDDIVHVLDGPLSNGAVHGTLDWGRRFELMQQHLGQHLLSASLYHQSSLRTARMRIEGDDVSIDLDVPVDEERIRQAEEEANEVVWRNLPVEILYPSLEEVQRLSRKMPPPDSGPIRIVKVEGVDYVPCCGLHVRSTGEVGIIKVTALEHHKGGTRVHLRCGRLAFRWLNTLCREARQVQLELTCGEEGMAERVVGLKAQIRELAAHNKELLNRQAEAQASELLQGAERIGGFSVVAHIGQGGQEEGKRLFHALTQDRGVVALLGGEQDGRAFLIFGSHKEDKEIDVREAFKEAAALIEGRGGGSAFCAQGFGKTPEALGTALDAAREALRKSLAAAG